MMLIHTQLTDVGSEWWSCFTCPCRHELVKLHSSVRDRMCRRPILYTRIHGTVVEIYALVLMSETPRNLRVDFE